MIEREEITSAVRVLDIVDYPPAIITEELTHPLSGGDRLFTQKVTVPDQGLFRRLQEGVRRGDTIDVTVLTEWRDDGYSTHLTAFAMRTLTASKPDAKKLQGLKGVG